jgi:menaquinol-cytochrome c reductase iron-sulfur subunit
MPDQSQLDPGASEPGKVGRRQVLVWLSMLPAAVGGILALIPAVGFLVSPVLRWKKDDWADAGKVEDHPLGQVRLVDLRNPLLPAWAGETARMSAYVHRLGEERFDVFSVHCTHLGCPVRWFPESGLFLCPCHGGVYYQNGDYAAGPPPRGLYRLPHRITNGRLEIKVGHFPTLHEPA